jgi:hypothetical protein
MGQRDSQALAKCLIAPELYMQQFNDECSTCKFREDVNENYLDFLGISFGISVQRIDVDLPDCFSKISLKPKPNVLPPPSDPNQDNKSRHKDKKRKIVQQNEDYKKFTGKEQLQLVDASNGTSKVTVSVHAISVKATYLKTNSVTN